MNNSDFSIANFSIPTKEDIDLENQVEDLETKLRKLLKESESELTKPIEDNDQIDQSDVKIG